MNRFPVKNIFIEGPDCSGKTTLIKEVHNITGYTWHIQDRSQISRTIFANLYNRDIRDSSFDYHIELSNLNNRFIILLPRFKSIKERFLKRGDDIHKTVESIENVYDAFSAHCEHLKDFPNVFVCKGEDLSTNISDIMSFLSSTSDYSLDDVSSYVSKFVSCAGGESYPLSFITYDDGAFKDADLEILNYKPESEYYEKIFNSLHEKISNELDGKNEYSRIEDAFSRRFVYTDNSCISFIQASVRNNIFDFHIMIRSSDVKKIFPYDIKFLYYLASTCFSEYFSCSGCLFTRMRFNLNSAHIIV